MQQTFFFFIKETKNEKTHTYNWTTLQILDLGFISVGVLTLSSILITPKRSLIPIRESLLVCKHITSKIDP